MLERTQVFFRKRVLWTRATASAGAGSRWWGRRRTTDERKNRMADREKVMQALKLCAAGCDDTGCIYDEETNGTDFRCVDYLTRDVLELLKEQEPVKPKQHLVYTTKGWFCGACDGRLNRLGKYCCFCGRPVKWNG